MRDHPDIVRMERYGYSEDEKLMLFTCLLCHMGIREGEGYYNIADRIYCAYCVDEAYRE